MSGPVVPPLEVTEVDGSPDGRPITKIIVSNGDLTISGREATIDTSGSATTPGGSDTEVQYNDGGAFGGDAGFIVSSAAGGVNTRVDVGNVKLGIGLQSQTLNHTVIVSAEGSGEITLTSNNDGGGTMTDMQVNISGQTATDDPILHLYNTGYSPGGKLHLDGGTGDFIITSGATSKDLDLKVNGTGQVEVQNTTTDTASVLSILGNGTGDARLDMQNASKRVWVVCDENKKLKIQGGSGGNTWIFDASSASGGVTFPDGTEQTTAASGGIGGSITDNQIAVGATSADDIEGDSDFTFDAATNTLMGASSWKIDTSGAGGGSIRIQNGGSEVGRFGSGGFQASLDGSAALPSIAFLNSYQTGFFRAAANILGIVTAATERLRVGSSGEIGIAGANYGTSGQLLTSGGSGAAVSWEDAALSTTAHATPPANASDTGTAGQLAYDADYFYVCIATDTWKRTALSTW